MAGPDDWKAQRGNAKVESREQKEGREKMPQKPAEASKQKTPEEINAEIKRIDGKIAIEKSFLNEARQKLGLPPVETSVAIQSFLRQKQELMGQAQNSGQEDFRFWQTAQKYFQDRVNLLRSNENQDEDTLDEIEKQEHAAADFRKFQSLQNFRENALKDPSQLSDTLALLGRELTEGITYHSSTRENFAPEYKPYADEQARETRKVFAGLGSKLFSDLPAGTPTSSIIMNVRGRPEIKHPALESVARYFREDFSPAEIAKMKESDPAGLLKKIESHIHSAGSMMNVANLNPSPETKVDLAETARIVYALELMRTDIESRIQGKVERPADNKQESANPRTPSPESQRPVANPAEKQDELTHRERGLHDRLEARMKEERDSIEKNSQKQSNYAAIYTPFVEAMRKQFTSEKQFLAFIDTFMKDVDKEQPSILQAMTPEERARNADGGISLADGRAQKIVTDRFPPNIKQALQAAFDGEKLRQDNLVRQWGSGVSMAPSIGYFFSSLRENLKNRPIPQENTKEAGEKGPESWLNMRKEAAYQKQLENFGEILKTKGEEGVRATFLDYVNAALAKEKRAPLSPDFVKGITYHEVTSDSASEVAGAKITRPVFIFDTTRNFKQFYGALSGQEEPHWDQISTRGFVASFGVQMPDGQVESISMIVAGPEDLHISHEVRHTVDPYLHERKGYDNLLCELFAYYQDSLQSPHAEGKARTISPEKMWQDFAVNVAGIRESDYYTDNTSDAKNPISFDQYRQLVSRAVEKVRELSGKHGDVEAQKRIVKSRTLEEFFAQT